MVDWRRVSEGEEAPPSAVPEFPRPGHTRASAQRTVDLLAKWRVAALFVQQFEDGVAGAFYDVVIPEQVPIVVLHELVNDLMFNGLTLYWLGSGQQYPWAVAPPVPQLPEWAPEDGCTCHAHPSGVWDPDCPVHGLPDH